METLVTNLDFEKAFDRVNHELLLLVLEKFGFGKFLINMIKACLSNCVSKVVLPNGGYSKGYSIQSGVRQGDCLSSAFCVVIDTLISDP